MRFRLLLAFAILIVSGAVTAVAVASSHSGSDSEGPRSDYEVWLVDQSNSRGSVASGHGGYLYIYKQRDLERKRADASPERIDLGAEVTEMCQKRTGSVPSRPHMVVFNGGASSSEGGTDAALTFVASRHVVFFDTESRLQTD